MLLIQTAFIGDTVFTSALAASVRRRFPEGQLDLCTAPRGADVARAMPGVGHVHVYDKRRADSGLSGLRRLASRLRTRQYQLAILPHRSPRTALLARLAGIPERVGFAGAPGSLFYTARVPSSATGFLAQEADLARALGGEPGAMQLAPRPEWLAGAHAALCEGKGDRFAALCLGSEWETKVWPTEHTAQLARYLHSRGLRPVLIGGPREKELAKKLSGIGGAIDTTGNTIGEALAILSLSALCVGGDTGLVHAARALGIPTVALFGPTSPLVHEFAPRQLPLSLHLACSPCSAHGQHACPLGHHRCLRDLEPSRVASACEELLI